MNMYFTIILLFCIRKASASQDFYNQKYNEYEFSELVPTRLLQVMRSYYEDATNRIAEMNPIRFTYEITPQYEMGYLIGEIIERYKKMVEHVKRPMEFKSDSVFDTLKRTELIQKLYFEAYHLVNMMHEIPIKYQYSPELLRDMRQADLDEVLKREQWIEATERQRILQLKADQKRIKKMRQLALKMGTLYKPVLNKTYNKWWPIDYGWEIDWYWR